MKITIITVTYNSEDTLEDTILSVINQSHDDIEFILIDGKSTDSTLNIANKYKHHFSKIISESDNGIYDAYNKGLTFATGDIIAILNSDDVFYDSNTLFNVNKEFEEKSCDIVFGNLDIVLFDDLNKTIRYWKSSKFQKGSFAKGWHPPHPSFFVKKTVYMTLGNFDINIPVSSDYEIMLRFLEKGDFKSSYIDMTLAKMRAGGHSQSLKNILRGAKSITAAHKKHKIQVNSFNFFLTRYLKKIVQYFR